MADHHDDRLDSALDLLRSRQWAGPATNPVLEKQFMHPIQESRGLNLRIVLGVAGALIGCGAVAAATRPAWRSAIFGPTPQPQKIAAAVVPAPTAPAPAPIVRKTEPAAIAEPVQAADIEAAAPEPAAQPLAEAAAPEPEVFTAVEPDQTEFLRTADPECFYQQALAAYLDRYMAGDVEGCARIARSVDGTNAAATFTGQFISAELGRLFAVSTLVDVEGQPLGDIRFKVALDGVSGDAVADSADAVFEIVLDRQAEGGAAADGQGNVVVVTGNLAGNQGSVPAQWVFTTVKPGAAPTPAPTSPAPR